MLKQIMIPVAALAITVTSASAFTGGTDWIEKLNISLSESEKAALEEAADIRETAQADAKAVLEKAGLDEEKMADIRSAMHDVRQSQHAAVTAALAANDFAAYQAAVADTPMAETIDTADKFARLVEAHTLLAADDRAGANAILDELGIEGHGLMMGGGRHGHHNTTPTNN